MLPENRIKLALDAASKYGEGVSPPYEIISLKWEGYENGDRYLFFDSDGTVKENNLINELRTADKKSVEEKKSSKYDWQTEFRRIEENEINSTDKS
jgi:hypothetical protein